MEHRAPSSKRLITVPVTACAALLIALAVSCGSKSSTTELVPAAGAGGLCSEPRPHISTIATCPI